MNAVPAAPERFDVALPAVLSGAGSSLRTKTVRLSPSGITVEGKIDAPPGASLAISLVHPDAGTVVVPLRLVAVHRRALGHQAELSLASATATELAPYLSLLERLRSETARHRVDLAYEIFFVIPGVAERFASLRSALTPLWNEMSDTAATQLCARFDPRSDTALVSGVCRASAFPRALRARVDQYAKQAAATVLEPARLPPAARDKFYNQYLTTYTVCGADLESWQAAVDAVIESARPAAAPPATQPPRIVSPITSEFAPTAGQQPLPVFYRHGDQWYTGRAIDLGEGTITVVTSVPPHRGVRLEIAFRTGSTAQPFSIPALILRRAGPETVIGSQQAPWFCARFLPADPQQHQELRQLLAARAAGAALGNPPPRRDIRFPTRWRVRVERSGRQMDAMLLDLSRGGGFVATDAAIATEGALGKELDLLIEFGELAPLQAPARVARIISEAHARESGLITGVGVQFSDLSTEPATRLEALLEEAARQALHRAKGVREAARSPER